MSLKSLQTRTTNDTNVAISELPNQAYCGRGVKYKAISCQTSPRHMEGASSCSATGKNGVGLGRVVRKVREHPDDHEFESQRWQ
jgi:hypothetical protein